MSLIQNLFFLFILFEILLFQIFSFMFQELIRLVVTHKAQIIRKDQYIKDLEKYIDDLLVRVMEVQPKLLQTL